MTLPVRKSLHDAVLQASKADTWEQATKEWNEVSFIFNGIGRSNCVCGNAIKYAYELFNGVTGQRLFPIGSDCVRHFHRLPLDQQLEEEEKLLRKVENLTRKGRKREEVGPRRNQRKRLGWKKSLKSVSNPFYLGNRMTNSTLSS